MQITIREPGSAITHFIGMMMAVFAAAPLLIKSALSSGGKTLLALSIFCISMILLYGASATYHSLNITGKALRVFRKLDHMMIFVLIAGSYTPVCLIILGGIYASCSGMGNRASWHDPESLLDYLSEMVFLRNLYCHGMGLRCRVRPLMADFAPCGFRLAPCRRGYLYRRRRNLRLKTSPF